MICNNKLLFQVGGVGGGGGGGGGGGLLHICRCYPAFSILGNIGTGKSWQKLKYLHKSLQIIFLFSI